MTGERSFPALHAPREVGRTLTMVFKSTSVFRAQPGSMETAPVRGAPPAQLTPTLAALEPHNVLPVPPGSSPCQVLPFVFPARRGNTANLREVDVLSARPTLLVL